MKKNIWQLSGLMAVCLVSWQAQAATWGYEGSNGPKQWGSLDSEYATCKSGKAQSPIDLTKASVSPVGTLKIDYKDNIETTPFETGHAVQVNVTPGNGIRIAGKPYKLVQFHFHTPSEHKMKGKSAPMEMHFVHQSKEGDLAVIGVMIQSGSENAMLKNIAQRVPQLRNRMKKPPLPMNFSELLPKDKTYYRYNGSLTTPPCSEGVKWFVMKQPITASQQTIEAFKNNYTFANNRPTQPINRRVVESAQAK